MDTPKPQNASESSKLHFLDYWRIIRIRKTVILAVFLLVVLTTTAVTFILPQQYSSTVRIEVGKDTPDIAPLLQGLQMQSSYDPYFIQTEFQKIKSKSVLHAVIEDPALNLNVEWAKRFGLDGALKTSETYQYLLKRVDVRETRNTSLIEIRVYSDDPKEAADIANKIAEVYKKQREAVKGNASEAGIEALEIKLKEQDALVEKAQAEVDRLKEENNISDIDAGPGAMMTLEPETVRALERERSLAESTYVGWKSMYEGLKGKTPLQLRHTIPTVAPDQNLNTLIGDLNEAQTRYAALVSELGPQNPDLQKLQATISNLNTQIDQRVDGVMVGLETRVRSEWERMTNLQQTVENAKVKDVEMTRKYRPYFQAKRDLEANQRIRETIMLRMLQETVDAALPTSSIVQIVDPAETPPKPVRPNIPVNIALGVVVGLLMGFGLAFFIEYLDTSVKTIDDVERALQAPVLGVIPQNVSTLVEEGLDSPHAEAYRVLRTNLLFARKDPTWNTVTVVSGGAGEGKSTTIFNLATVFAQNGHRCLIVDSDLRRPSLHKLMKVTNSLGLTNYLLKQNTFEEVVQTSPVPGLHFLASGKLPSSSLGILNSAQMKEFIATAKQKYDFVFFDSPPIMGVSDASVLASSVDMSLLVIQYRKYPQAMTIRAKQMVEKVGGNLMGVVLNNINISQDSYYYYYSGYYYDYYSKHDDETGAPSKKKSGQGKSQAGAGAGVEIKQKY